MGCGSSKGGLEHVDDSVHVMLQHDKKAHLRKGGPAPGYKPRSAHPLLTPKEVNTPVAGGEGANGAAATTANGPIATEE